MNIQRLITSSNHSYHPLMTLGRNPFVPSLIHPTRRRATSTARLPRKRSGGRPGPHGSAFSPILKANYTITDGQAESAFQYGLCYLCHNRNTVLSPASWSLHSMHVASERLTCYDCHNSHGSTQYPHLIFFNARTVLGNSHGR